MIKIIKEGKTDFRMTCDKCGCIFEYNVADIDDCHIKCPTCHKKHYAFEPESKSVNEFNVNFGDNFKDFHEYTTPVPLIGTLDPVNACKDCEYSKQLATKGFYIGDSPRQWCSKNPYKLTCNGNGGTTVAINHFSEETTVTSNYYTEVSNVDTSSVKNEVDVHTDPITNKYSDSSTFTYSLDN